MIVNKSFICTANKFSTGGCIRRGADINNLGLAVIGYKNPTNVV